VMARHISAATLFYGPDLDTPVRDLQPRGSNSASHVNGEDR
jgi:hypothetical protein